MPDEPSTEEIRDWLRRHATIVKPGECLVIQVSEGWDMEQVAALSDVLRWNYEDGLIRFRCLVVPGTGMAVAPAAPGDASRDAPEPATAGAPASPSGGAS